MAALPPSPAPPFCASRVAVFERPYWRKRGPPGTKVHAQMATLSVRAVTSRKRERALSGAHDDIAHRLAGLDCFMRGDDLAEIEGLRHVVDELAAFQHARDVG